MKVYEPAWKQNGSGLSGHLRMEINPDLERFKAKLIKAITVKNQYSLNEKRPQLLETSIRPWEHTGSNRGPSACKADALNQLSYAPFFHWECKDKF